MRQSSHGWSSPGSPELLSLPSFTTFICQAPQEHFPGCLSLELQSSEKVTCLTGRGTGNKLTCFTSFPTSNVTWEDEPGTLLVCPGTLLVRPGTLLVHPGTLLVCEVLCSGVSRLFLPTTDLWLSLCPGCGCLIPPWKQECGCIGNPKNHAMPT